MKKKCILSFIFFIAVCVFLCTFSNAVENVLVISNDEIMASDIKMYMENISNNDFDVTQLSFGNNNSLRQQYINFQLQGYHTTT